MLAAKKLKLPPEHLLMLLVLLLVPNAEADAWHVPEPFAELGLHAVLLLSFFGQLVKESLALIPRSLVDILGVLTHPVVLKNFQRALAFGSLWRRHFGLWGALLATARGRPRAKGPSGPKS